MNKVILMGRLTRDPEVRYSQGTNSRGESTAIARYSLAVDRRFKRDGEPDADFFNCTCFGRQAEFAEKYLRKGTKILITGRIQNDNYTNREGQMVYSVQVMVDEQEFAESKNASVPNACPPHFSMTDMRSLTSINLSDALISSLLKFLI